MQRRNLTYRVVPLESDEARDARLGSTVNERLDMVIELSRAAWIASGRPFPQYERHNMPIRLSRLSDQGGPDDR
jgi:hypothetical protein